VAKKSLSHGPMKEAQRSPVIGKGKNRFYLRTKAPLRKGKEQKKRRRGTAKQPKKGGSAGGIHRESLQYHMATGIGVRGGRHLVKESGTQIRRMNIRKPG